MFGMDHNSFLLLDALVTIIGLVLLITKFKVHPFIALTIASGFLGLTSGMPVEKVMKSFQDGFGGVLGFVGIAGMEFGAAVLSMAPFVPGDLIKLVVAVILVVGLWKAYPRAFR